MKENGKSSMFFMKKLITPRDIEKATEEEICVGTYYSIYAEAHVGDKWYNISPLIKEPDGSLRVCPIVGGKSWLRDTYDELENDRYMCGKPMDLSPELRETFDHDDDETYTGLNMTYQQYYKKASFLLTMGRA